MSLYKLRAHFMNDRKPTSSLSSPIPATSALRCGWMRDVCELGESLISQALGLGGHGYEREARR